jgi:hypothetical protein
MVGVPTDLFCDGAPEQVGPKTEFMRTVRRFHINLHQSEPHSPQQNRVEGTIRELKRRWNRIMSQFNVPYQFWDYALVYVSETMSRTSNSIYVLHGRTPYERVTGDTPDISEWIDFAFYQFVWFKLHPGVESPELGRWLGVSHRVGSDMCFWILNKNARVLSRTTVQPVGPLELQTDTVKEKCNEFQACLDRHLPASKPTNNGMSSWHPRDTLVEPTLEEVNVADTLVDDSLPDQDEFTPDAYDKYLGAELLLARDDQVHPGKVVARKRDSNGDPIGKSNGNPLLDTRLYMVEFSDGHHEEFSANFIAENMFAQIDIEGKRHLLISEIVDHKCDSHALPKHAAAKGFRTTMGWSFLVQWKDSSTSWISMKYLKSSNPIELAEYAVANQLANEPAFSWWVPQVLRRRNRIIKKLKSNYWIRTHKYGIRLPKSVKEALQLDANAGTSLWRQAIEKEMTNVRPAFTLLEGGDTSKLVGYQEIKCHMVFDVKIDFTRKARFVAGGHTTDTPTVLTYASVVSRDSVRIAFMLAALNQLDVVTCDIQNAYLNADCREKVWTRAGPEFGSEQGQVMLVTKALYGLKSSGAAFRAMLAQTIQDLGYKSTLADPDVWIRPAIKPDGFLYYEMLLVYVDDILHMSHDTEPTMHALQVIYRLKDDKVEPPTRYLGAVIKNWNIADSSIHCWAMSSESYVRNAVKQVESELDQVGKKLSSRASTPMSIGYRPEIDCTPTLDATHISYYQQQIGVLRWAIELGRIDILTEVTMLSSYLASPRTGHLDQVFHVFAYLKAHSRSTIVFDPAHPIIDERRFVKCDWNDYYPGAAEPIPLNAPQARGNYVSIHAFVDSDHAGDRLTRRSMTGILIFVNRAPIVWFCKKQNTVESSTFGSEFVALRTAVDLIEALRYKLRMFGVPLEGPANVFCDNESVVKNTTQPDSTLSKKHNAINYHRVREAVAAGTIRVAKEDTNTNLADLFTKPLDARRRNELVQRILY